MTKKKVKKSIVNEIKTKNKEDENKHIRDMTDNEIAEFEKELLDSIL